MSHPLEERLRQHGIRCRVEARDRLAVLIPDDGALQLGMEARRHALQLVREAGFSHVSVELDPVGAAFPRD